MKPRYLLFAALIALGCQKQEVEAPEFEVSTAKTTYKANENIQFNFSGNPDVISFFSGEIGKRYEMLNRETASGAPKLAFTTVRAQGTQANSLQLMVSTDFQGTTLDSATTVSRINAATWTDITSRAALSTGASLASGNIDLSDIAAGGKPVFIAFKYNGALGSIQNKWTISGLTLTNTLADGTVYTIANLGTAAIANYGVSTVFSPGWVGYRTAGGFNWQVGTSLIVTGATSVATSTTNSTSWAISGPIKLNKVSGDVGLAVKEASTRVDNYNFTYVTPGDYTATFRAANTNRYGSGDIIKQIKITVTP